MRTFNNETIKVNDIIAAKKALRQQQNNNDAIKNVQDIIADTPVAIDNIQEMRSNSDLLQQVWIRIRNADTSFGDNILGTSEQGSNGSHYRPYLALDGKNIIQIRIADHYETKKTCLDKSNNKVQYLFQVVLITEPPRPEAKDSIKSNQSIGNVKILTNDVVGQDAEPETVVTMFQKLSSYLQAPSDTYENNKQNINCNKNMNKSIIRLSESQLHRLIKESVNNALDEESYRKAAKKGHHVSSHLKGELNYSKKSGQDKTFGLTAKSFNNWAKKYGGDVSKDVNGRALTDFDVDNNDDTKTWSGKKRLTNEAVAKKQYIVMTDDKRAVIKSPIGNFLTLSSDIAHRFDKKTADRIVDLFAQHGIKVTAVEYLGKMNRDTHQFELDESIRRAIKKTLVQESVENVIQFVNPEDLGKGRHRQTILYRGKEIGYYLELEKNFLTPIEEVWVLPDVEYGMQGDDGSGTLFDGKKGWIDFKTFRDENEALSYIHNNADQLAYLFEYGDYD